MHVCVQHCVRLTAFMVPVVHGMPVTILEGSPFLAQCEGASGFPRPAPRPHPRGSRLHSRINKALFKGQLAACAGLNGLDMEDLQGHGQLPPRAATPEQGSQLAVQLFTLPGGGGRRGWALQLVLW